MCDAKTLFMDGTFKSVPKIFLQLYTIHFIYFEVVFSVIYALLPNKSETTYNRMNGLLIAKANSLGKCLLPTNFQLDFEITMLNTIKNKYPDAQIRGCFFHYTKACFNK